MDTHSEIIRALGVANVAAQCSVSAEAVRKWAQRDSIPGAHWLSVARYSAEMGQEVPLQRLAEIAAQKAARTAA